MSHAIGAPLIWWVSDYTLANESALIVGDDFGSIAKVKLESETGLKDIEIIQQNNQQLSVRLPATISYHSHALRLYQPDLKTFERVWLNAPKIDWLQGDMGVKTSTGQGWLQLSGKNVDTLNLQDAFLINKTGKSYSLSLKESDPWHAVFNLPKQIPVGSYQLKFGQKVTQPTIPPLEVFIVNQPTDFQQRVLNIKDFHQSEDSIDHTIAFKTALADLATHGGGTLYLPAGHYRLSNSLFIPKNTQILGDGNLATHLIWSKIDKQESIALINLEDNTRLQGFSMYHDDAAFGINSPSDRVINNVHIEDIVIRMSAYRGHPTSEMLTKIYDQILKRFSNKLDTIRLQANNITLKNNDIYGTGRSFAFIDSHGINIQNNKFYNGRRGWYSFSGCSEIIFRNNTITGADLMASGGGINTLGNKVSSRNLYFANNTLGMFNGWDREAFTSDGGGASYFGHVQSHKENQLLLATNLRSKGLRLTPYEGAVLFVVDGKGVGQYAKVISMSENLVHLDRKLDVALDNSSKIIICPLQENYIIVNNTISDAAIGIQLYGTGLNHVVYGNTSIRTGGINLLGLWYGGYQSAWYTLVAHNALYGSANTRKFNPTRTDLHTSNITVEARPRSTDELNLVYGIVIRNNQLYQNNGVSIIGSQNARKNMDAIFVDPLDN
ncbi:pectate lyase-like protein [Agitococcus lubricus]|uniref:Pectate lyase-like protein n=2 Tax=Agitococcus lubricus TaxID=1077255 RepID=A0A2T5J0A2_9GAMM|nr:pectate lyase-like protein [Agitococcus lubricus]